MNPGYPPLPTYVYFPAPAPAGAAVPVVVPPSLPCPPSAPSPVPQPPARLSAEGRLVATNGASVTFDHFGLFDAMAEFLLPVDTDGRLKPKLPRTHGYVSVPRYYPPLHTVTYNVGYHYQAPQAPRPQITPRPSHQDTDFPSHPSNLPASARLPRPSSPPPPMANLIPHGAQSAPPALSSEPSRPYVLCHFCGACGRLRSKAYHHSHPLIPGELTAPELCRRCVKKQGRYDGYREKQLHSRRRSRERTPPTLRIQVGEPSAATEMRIVRRSRSKTWEDSEKQGRRSASRASLNIRIKGDPAAKHGPPSSPPAESPCKETRCAHVLQEALPPLEAHDSSESFTPAERTISYNHLSTEQRKEVKNIVRETIRNHRQAEQRLASHPVPYSHGRLVPIDYPPRHLPTPSQTLRQLSPLPYPTDTSPVRSSEYIPSAHSAHTVDTIELGYKCYPSGEPYSAREASRGRPTSRIRSIMRSLSRSRYRSPSTEDARRYGGRSSDSTSVDVGGPRVQFAPEPPSSRRQNTTLRDERSIAHLRIKQQQRDGIDGHYSSDDHVPGTFDEPDSNSRKNDEYEDDGRLDKIMFTCSNTSSSCQRDRSLQRLPSPPPASSSSLSQPRRDVGSRVHVWQAEGYGDGSSAEDTDEEENEESSSIHAWDSQFESDTRDSSEPTIYVDVVEG